MKLKNCRKDSMIYHEKYIDYLISKGGPDEKDYVDLDAWIHEVHDQVSSGELTKSDKEKIISRFGDSFSDKTMQGFAFLKPHGYAGDYEIIERIYQRYLSGDCHLRKWDLFWQNHAAAKAVRNRSEYFTEILLRKEKKRKRFRVLNVASGPGRDMFHFFEKRSGSGVEFDCVDQDKNAIDYAQNICSKNIDKICFYQQNALRIDIDCRYDLVWSAGLFDYFSDRVFVHVLKKLLKLVLPESGEVVIGNFSTINPSKKYMELFEWNLQHRSPQKLVSLAEECGVERGRIHVNSEQEGVNLFLHILGR